MAVPAFWRLAATERDTCKTRANSERTKGHLTFPAVAMTYSPGNLIQMERSFVFRFVRLPELIVATIRSASCIPEFPV